MRSAARSPACRADTFSRGVVQSRLTAAISIVPPSSATFTTIACPYEVSQSEDTVGRWTTAAATPDAISTFTETNATIEKRGTHTARPATRRVAGRRRPEHEQPDQPADPDRAGGQVRPVEEERPRARRRLRRVPGEPGDEQHRAGREARADEREQLDHRPVLALRTVDPQRHERREREEQERQLEIDEPASERRRADQRHERADVVPRAKRELRRREQQIDGRRDQRQRRRGDEGDRERRATACRSRGARPVARSRSAARTGRSPP